MKISVKQNSVRQLLVDLFTITRFPSVIAGGGEAVLGCYLATGNISTHATRAGLVAIAMSLSVAAAMVLNDLADVAVDRISKSHRPLPSGRRSSTWAGRLTATLTIGALAAAIPLGLGVTLATAAVCAVSAVYSYRLKNTVLIGNLTVALCACSPVIIGAAAVGSVTILSATVAGMIFLFMLAYEITKTTADRDSDRVSGLNTVATVFDGVIVVRLLWLIVGVLAASAVAVLHLAAHPVAYLVVVTVFLALVLIAILRLRRDINGSGIESSVLAMRLAWVTGSVSPWLLR